MVHTNDMTLPTLTTMLINTSNHGNASVQTPEVEDEDRPVLAVMGMLAFFSVIGTAGNAMVLYVYVRKRHKLAATIFIITLAATDFMTSLVVVPYTIAVEYLDYYVKYDFACKLYMFFITSNVPFAAFIMVAIAFDRYLCICHPFMHLMNAKRAKMTLLALLFIAVTLGVITSLNYGVYDLSEVDICSNALSDETGQNLTILTTGEVHSIIYNSSQAQHSLGIGLPIVLSTQRRSCMKYNITYTGRCWPNEVIFSSAFITNYQKVYAAFFLVALLAVIVLYGMVYRSVLVRRAKRRRQRRSTRTVSLTKDSWFSEYRQSQHANGHAKNTGHNGEERHPDVELARQLTIRERGLVANIRTAAMLFVVTAMFIIAFLPAWLMAHDVVTYNMVVFYMYFIYNVANPIIYAFMNKAFRRDLRDVFDCKAILRDFR